MSDCRDVFMAETIDETTKPLESLPINANIDAENTSPLMVLIKKLVRINQKENTVLTNAEIFNILKVEFNVDVSALHDLEVDIYLNIVKRFLKDWPQWNEFDRGISNLKKCKTPQSSFDSIIESKYNNLKEYLKMMIEATQPLARDVVAKMQAEKIVKAKNAADTSNLTLEVYCSRRQLNKLFLRYPENTIENNIFEVLDSVPTTITVGKLPLEAILNWWGVKITIDLKTLQYTRTTSHKLTHTLVNKYNGERNLKRVLNEAIEIKDAKRTADPIKRNKLDRILKAVLQQNIKDTNLHSYLQIIFNIIKRDMRSIENLIVPSSYRQHSNKYPYYRLLVSQNNPAMISNNVDLYLEETVSPMHEFHLGRLGHLYSATGAPDAVWLTVECTECKAEFKGRDYHELMVHFDENHSNEPDWTCTNCKETFTMAYLARHNWNHQC